MMPQRRPPKPRAKAEWDTRHVFIFARGHRDAADYARRQQLHPANWTFLASPEQLQRSPGAAVVRVGAWFERKDAADIEAAMEANECRDVFAVRPAGVTP